MKKDKRFGFVLEYDEYEKLKKLAIKEDRSVSNIVQKIIKADIAKWEKGKK